MSKKPLACGDACCFDAIYSGLATLRIIRCQVPTRRLGNINMA
jgi:hypothetical protein